MEERAGNGDKIPERELMIPISELTTQLKISEVEFYRITSVMLAADEILFRYGLGGEKCVIPDENSAPSFYSNKYIKVGENHVIGRTKDYLGIIVNFIAIISAIATGIIAISSTDKTQEEIQALRQEVQQIRQTALSGPQPKIYSGAPVKKMDSLP